MPMHVVVKVWGACQAIVQQTVDYELPRTHDCSLFLYPIFGNSAYKGAGDYIIDSPDFLHFLELNKGTHPGLPTGVAKVTHSTLRQNQYKWCQTIWK
jgi:hypothetical protein